MFKLYQFSSIDSFYVSNSSTIQEQLRIFTSEPPVSEIKIKKSSAHPLRFSKGGGGGGVMRKFTELMLFFYKQKKYTTTYLVL